MRTSFGTPAAVTAGAPAPVATRTAPPPPRRVAPAPVAAAPAAPVIQPPTTPQPAAAPVRTGPPGRRSAVVAAPAPAPVVVTPPEPPVVVVLPPEVVVPPAAVAVVAVPPTRTRRTKAEMAQARASVGTQSAEPIAPGQTSEVVVYNEPPPRSGGLPPVGTIEGVVESTDLALPQLKVANAVGPLSKLSPPVPPGTIVVGAGEQWLYLWQEWQERNATSGVMETFQSPPVGVTIIRGKKQFGQLTDEKGQNLYDQEMTGMTFDTKEEMQAAGGMIGSAVPGMLGFEAQLTCHVLVRMPEGLEDDLGLFNIEHLDGLFMQAMWYIRGSSYNECAKKIFTEKTGFLINGSHTAEFDMVPKRIIGKRNSWFVPTLVNGGYHTQGMVDYLAHNA